MKKTRIKFQPNERHATRAEPHWISEGFHFYNVVCDERENHDITLCTTFFRGKMYPKKACTLANWSVTNVETALNFEADRRET